MKKIEGTIENWESGKLGKDERYVNVATLSEEEKKAIEEVVKEGEKNKT